MLSAVNKNTGVEKTLSKKTASKKTVSGLTFHIIEPRRRRDKKRGSQRIIFKVFSAFSVLSAVNKKRL